jgi:predicted nucleic acid-binding protein
MAKGLSVFLDTSALVWRYVPGAASQAVDAQIQAAPSTIISDWVMVEWSSGLALQCRLGNIKHSDYKANEIALMTDIADGRIVVVRSTVAYERVRNLIEYVGARLLRGLKSGDAIQVVTAMEATTRYGKLRFVTSDKQLSAIVRDIEPMASTFETLYLQP